MAKAAKKDPALTPEEKLAQALIPESEQPYPVPENWCWTKIGVLSSLHRGVSYKKDDAHADKQENDCLVMRGGNIGEGYIDVDAENVYVDLSLVNKDQLVKKNDIIIVASTGSTKVIGRAGISFDDYSDVAFGAFLMAVRPSEKAIPRYMDFYFQSDLYRDRIRDLASGVNINNIRSDYITESPYPLPPLAEQQRIVDCIESLFAKLDEAKEKAQAVVDGFEDRKAAILHKAFTGELTGEWRKQNHIDNSKWEIKPLSSITYNHDSKRIPLSKEERANLDRKYDYYGASGVIDQVDRYLFDGKFLLIGEDGANLVTRSKPIAFIAEGQYWVNNHAHILSTTDEILMEFLCYYINSISLLPYVTGSAQPKMTQAKMNTIPIPVPTIKEQKEIVQVLNNLVDKMSQAMEAAEQVLDQIDAMKKSILARAFRGELGTNDPADESAEELLKRIL